MHLQSMWSTWPDPHQISLAHISAFFMLTYNHHWKPQMSARKKSLVGWRAATNVCYSQSNPFLPPQKRIGICIGFPVLLGRKLRANPIRRFTRLMRRGQKMRLRASRGSRVHAPQIYSNDEGSKVSQQPYLRKWWAALDDSMRERKKEQREREFAKKQRRG